MWSIVSNREENKSSSVGILSGLNRKSDEKKQQDTEIDVRNRRISSGINGKTKKEKIIKRSYDLRESTVKKIQELKVFIYSDSTITYNEIVDEAICQLYEAKNTKK